MATPRRPSLAAAVLLLLAAAAAQQAAAQQASPLSAWYEGSASFFGGPSDPSSNAYKMTIDSGSCGYGDIDPRLYPFYSVAGLHPTNSIVQGRPEAACGSCLEVECLDARNICYRAKPLQVLITDQCNAQCNATNINLHVFAFEQLAPLRVGRMNIRYRLVECDPADPITIKISKYRASAGGWIRMAFMNMAGDGALVSVELARALRNGTSRAANATGARAPAQRWMRALNTFGGSWELSMLPRPPLDIRLTNSIRQRVIIRNAITVAGMTGEVETTAQFGLSGAPAAPAGAPAAGNGTPAFASRVRPLNSYIPSAGGAAAAPAPTLVSVGESVVMRDANGSVVAPAASAETAAQAAPLVVPPAAAAQQAPPADGAAAPAGPTVPEKSAAVGRRMFAAGL